MTEGENAVPLASLDMTIESNLIHPGTVLMAEVKLKNTGKSVLQLTDEAYSYANQFQIAGPGAGPSVEKDAKTVSAKQALDERASDDRPSGPDETLTLQPDEENVDREDVAGYLSAPLKPGPWQLRVLRKTKGKETVQSPWKSFSSIPWQVQLAGLRYDPQANHWQAAILNKETGGNTGLWVRYSSGAHPASGTFKEWTESLEGDSPNPPEPGKITSLAFAQLYSSTSDEWMLVKEGGILRAIKSSGEPVEICHGTVVDGDRMEIYESGIAVDQGNQAVFAGIDLANPSAPKIRFFKAGGGKVEEWGSGSLGNQVPGKAAISWSNQGASISASVAFTTKNSGGTAYWVQEWKLDLHAPSAHSTPAVQKHADTRTCLAVQWDPAQLPQAKSAGLALLFATKDPHQLELIALAPGKAAQKRAIVLSPGLKPEKAVLCTQGDGQWALAVLSGGGIFLQKPGSDSWTLLAQEKSPVKTLRLAKGVEGALWAAWITETHGLNWAGGGL